MRKNQLLAMVALVSVAGFAQAQFYSDDFNTDSSANYTVFQTADASIQWAYDYSALGIPSANGNDTVGVRFNVNDAQPGSVDGIMALVNGVNLEGSYTITFDMYGVVQNNTTGSTEFANYGLGTGAGSFTSPTGGTPGVALWSDGIMYSNTFEGGAARDYRVYRNGTELLVGGTGDTDPGLLAGSSDAANAYYASLGDAGRLQNTWAKVKIEQTVDGSNVVNSWYINDLLIAQRTEAMGGATDGLFYLGAMDVFTSVNDGDVAMIYDNLEIVPEPATLLALGAGIAALAARRRNKR